MLKQMILRIFGVSAFSKAFWEFLREPGAPSVVRSRVAHRSIFQGDFYLPESAFMTVVTNQSSGQHRFGLRDTLGGEHHPHRIP